MRLQDRVAIVTGGARGIGAGIGRALAAEGARVAVVDLDEEQATATAAELGGGAIALRADLAEEADVAALVEKVISRFGRLDFMVNNAGAGRAPVETSTPLED